MKKIGWILYGISLLLMIVKLFVLGTHQLDTFNAIFFQFDISVRILLDALIVYGLIIDPILISISIIGFVYRKNTGFLISLIYAYYVFSYHILSLFSFDPYHNNADLGPFTFSLIILFFLNIRPVTKIFEANLTVRNQIIYNSISLFIGLAIGEGLHFVVNSFATR